MSLGVGKVIYAGFDGYGKSEGNYFDSGYLLPFTGQSNEQIRKQLETVIQRHGCRNVSFITPSEFAGLFGETDYDR